MVFALSLSNCSTTYVLRPFLTQERRLYEHVSYRSHENTGKEPKKISTAITDTSHLYT